MRVLIGRHPEDDTALNVPYFYGAATRGLEAFAQVDEIVLRPIDRPIGEIVDLEPYDGVVSFGGTFTDACLSKAPRLRIVAGFRFGGLGEEVLESKGIPFLCLEGGFVRSVAELGLGLTLCCLRNISLWDRRIKSNDETWPRRQFSDNAAFVNGDLCGKRVGVFGFGRIGQHYARLARAFGAVVAATDPLTPDDAFAELGAERKSLDDLLTWSQILVIASSATPENKGLIDRDRFYKLPRGSCLIVIGRAWPLDMGAVRERIRAGEICAGLDVFDGEPIAPDDVLRQAQHTVLTPHVGGRSADNNRLMAEMVVEAFREALT